MPSAYKITNRVIASMYRCLLVYFVKQLWQYILWFLGHRHILTDNFCYQKDCACYYLMIDPHCEDECFALPATYTYVGRCASGTQHKSRWEHARPFADQCVWSKSEQRVGSAY